MGENSNKNTTELEVSELGVNFENRRPQGCGRRAYMDVFTASFQNLPPTRLLGIVLIPPPKILNPSANTASQSESTHSKLLANPQLIAQTLFYPKKVMRHRYLPLLSPFENDHQSKRAHQKNHAHYRL